MSTVWSSLDNHAAMNKDLYAHKERDLHTRSFAVNL